MSILDADERHAAFTIDFDLTTLVTSISIGPDANTDRIAATLRLLLDHYIRKADQ